MDYTGETTDAGKTVDGPHTYRRTRFFPRNSGSIIEQLDVEINGQTRFTLNNYGFVYNTLFDLTAVQDSLNRRKVGENADPSSKCFVNGGVAAVVGDLTERRGYSVGNTVDGSVYDKDNYVIRSCLGLLNPSTSILDTNILGSVVIKIRLAPPSCLMIGSAICNTTIATLAANHANNETGVAVAEVLAQPPVGAAALFSVSTAGYSLSNVKFTIVRYDLPSEFYMTEASRLVSGAVFKLWFPNYSVQSCPSVTSLNKQGVNRTSISCR
jgi:hypothetical protein